MKFILFSILLLLSCSSYAENIRIVGNINELIGCKEIHFASKNLKIPIHEKKLSESTEKKLLTISEKIKTWNAIILIIGHANKTNTPLFSFKNSIKRAKIVKKILLDNGVKKLNIKIMGRGEDSPPFLELSSSEDNQTVSFDILNCENNKSYKKELVLATATKGGTYYPIGKILANMWNDTLKDSGISVKVISTQGSKENIDLLKKGKADLAMMTSMVAFYAYAGMSPDIIQPYKEFTAISSLWKDVHHFITTPNMSTTGFIDNVKDNEKIRFCIGKEKSGTALTTKIILDSMGYDNISRQYCAGYDEASESFLNGKYEIISIAGGDPVDSIERILLKNKEAIILQFKSQDLLNEKFSELQLLPYTIKNNTYSNQNKPIETIAEPNILVINNNINPAVIDLLSESFFKNLSSLSWSHKAFKEVSKDKFDNGIPKIIPVHHP
ncbi:MAG: TAXI family TRAP transporter solute-binding subunit [Cocleimonas sp.]|nr:TAXI family TRAP transporter solute-binding subunit [Cocleimonas sp.]